MTTVAVATPQSKTTKALVIAGGVVALLVIAQVVGSPSFPSNWYARLADPINDWQGWLRTNRSTHWSFTVFINPLTDLVPVCPNCHAMLHHGVREPRTVAELRRILAQTS